MTTVAWISEIKREINDLVRHKRFSESIDTLKRWTCEKLLFQASTAQFAEFCCGLANDLLVQDHAEAALAVLQFAVKQLQQPRLRAMLFHACGAHFYNRGMFNLAAKSFKDALDADAREPGISPNSTDKVTTLISLATSFIQMGERDQAALYLNQALGLSKNVYTLRDLHQTANNLINSLAPRVVGGVNPRLGQQLSKPVTPMYGGQKNTTRQLTVSRKLPANVVEVAYQRELKPVSGPVSSATSKRSSTVSEESIDGSILAERETAKYKVALVDRPRFKRVEIVVTHKSGKQKKVVLGDEELRNELAHLSTRETKIDLDTFWRDIVQGVDVRGTKSHLTVQVVLPSQQSELPAVQRLLQGLQPPQVVPVESARERFRQDVSLSEESKIEEPHSSADASVESGYRVIPSNNRPRPLSAQEKLTTEIKPAVKWSSRPQSAKGPKPKRFVPDAPYLQQPPFHQYNVAFARQKRPVSSKDRKHRREHIEDGDNLYVYDDEEHESEPEDEFDEEHEILLLDEADPELVDNEHLTFCVHSLFTMIGRKRVAVYGGSFDPITIAHLLIAAEVIHFRVADEVWIVPCGNRPDKDTIVDASVRLRMCDLAVTGMFPADFPVKVISTEIDAGCYIPTVYLMRKFREQNPDLDFSVVIGSDLVDTLMLWDLPDELLAENHFVVVPRCSTAGVLVPLKTENCNFKYSALEVSDQGYFVGVSNLSSTEARHRLKTVGICGAAGIVPLAVLQFIQDNHLYGC